MNSFIFSVPTQIRFGKGIGKELKDILPFYVKKRLMVSRSLNGSLKETFTELTHNEGKEVGICGELASDEKCLSYFLNININSLSMPPTLIPKIKNEIRNTI